MTSVPATPSFNPNPSAAGPEKQARHRREPESPAADYAALAAATITVLPAAVPLVQVVRPGAQPADPAPTEAQAPEGRAADIVRSAALSDGQRLARRHSAERPNQVDLAHRATQELSTPRDPLRLIPGPADGAQPMAKEKPGPDGATSGPQGTDGSQDHAAAHEPGPSPGPDETSTSTSMAPGSKPVTPQAQAQHQQVAAAQTVVAQAPVNRAGAAAIPPPAGPSRPAAVSRLEGPGPGSGSGHPPVRDRLWRHLDRLGQPAARAKEAHTPARGEANSAPFEAQLARGLAAALKKGDGQVTLRLAPEALGQLRIDLKVSEDRVTALIAASSEQARRLLESDVVTLKTALEAAGLGVERIDVVGTPAEPATQPALPETDHPTGLHNGNSGSHPGPGGHAAREHGDRRSSTGAGPAVAEPESDQPETVGYVLSIDFLA